MNTEARRMVFSALMSSLDYQDAAHHVMQLKLNDVQRREVIRVLLHCLANERTFLAWVRTALALLAGGVAVEAFTGALFAPPVRVVLSTVLLVLAALLALGAGARWLRVERAMRRGRPLPLPLIVPVLAGGVVLAVVVLLAAVVLPRG